MCYLTGCTVAPYQEVTALPFNEDARDSQKNPFEKRTVDLRQRSPGQAAGSFFFFWMLHGSTKVVVRAVALLSANTKDKVAMSLSKLSYFRESNDK